MSQLLKPALLFVFLYNASMISASEVNRFKTSTKIAIGSVVVLSACAIPAYAAWKKHTNNLKMFFKDIEAAVEREDALARRNPRYYSRPRDSRNDFPQG